MNINTTKQRNAKNKVLHNHLRLKYQNYQKFSWLPHKNSVWVPKRNIHYHRYIHPLHKQYLVLLRNIQARGQVGLWLNSFHQGLKCYLEPKAEPLWMQPSQQSEVKNIEVFMSGDMEDMHFPEHIIWYSYMIPDLSAKYNSLRLFEGCEKTCITIRDL